VSFLGLVLVNLGRNKLRTLLTFGSVVVALFLFCALNGVLDTLQAAIKVGSETRMATRNAISLVFPLPLSYRDRIAAVPGVKAVSTSNWFGGRDPVNPHNFFAQFAVDAATYLPIYAADIQIAEASPAVGGTTAPPGVDPRLTAFMNERQACLVGAGLMKRMGWKLGQTVTLQGTIYPGDWPFTIRAVYRVTNKALRDDAMFFHWKYLEEKGLHGAGLVGVYVLQIADPSQAAEVARRVDAMFVNSSAATRTETERAFQAGFVSMYGNIPFVLGIVGLAVVFSILLVAGNTMMSAFRERIAEIGVMKTLGFEDRTVFALVLVEAGLITVGGGVAGALLAKALLTGVATGILPPMHVDARTVLLGIGVAALLGVVSGVLPAWQASRLRIVDALRRV
jgi:putative ABC transport system permease protein